MELDKDFLHKRYFSVKEAASLSDLSIPAVHGYAHRKLFEPEVPPSHGGARRGKLDRISEALFPYTAVDVLRLCIIGKASGFHVHPEWIRRLLSDFDHYLADAVNGTNLVAEEIAKKYEDRGTGHPVVIFDEMGRPDTVRREDVFDCNWGTVVFDLFGLIELKSQQLRNYLEARRAGLKVSVDLASAEALYAAAKAIREARLSERTG